MGNSSFVYVVFILVYLGMIFGRLPRLALDRTGIVVLGAIALLARPWLVTGGGRWASTCQRFCFFSASW